MKLSILMAELRCRPPRMRPIIEAQIAGRRDVEFLVETDDGRLPSGAKRQRLLEAARGEYVAFVDDDDEVSPQYVEEIASRCGAADVVTFELQMFRNERLAERWSFGVRTDDRRRGRMAANHLCAWRTELALRVGFSPIGYGDDQLFYGPLIASGLVRRESHIPRPLYRYLWRDVATANQHPEAIAASRAYFGAGIRCWRDCAGEIYVGAGQQSGLAYRRGHAVALDLSMLEHFHTVRLQ